MIKGTSEDIAKARAQRLIALRERLGFNSRREFALKIKIPATTLQNWEGGLFGGLSEKGANRLINTLQKEGFNCTVEWLLYGIGDSPLEMYEFQTKPSSEQTIITQELKFFLKLNPDAISAIISDNSMLPCYVPGDHVAGKRYFGDDIQKAINSICIIQPMSGNILVRKLELGSKKGHFTLKCTNEKFKNYSIINDVQLLFVAPIIWIRRCSISQSVESNLASVTV